MASEALHLRRRTSARTVVEAIWDQLRKLILDGTLAPGTRLVELDIAAQTKASQASVRGALQRLERDGLVVRKGRTGTYVAEVIPEDLNEIFSVRSVAESSVVRRLALSIRPQQLRVLRGLVERMRDAARAGDPVGLVKHDMAFHEHLYLWAGHPTLLAMWTLIQAQLERFLIIYDAANYADLMEVADCHTPIIDALEAKDPDRAESEIQQHVGRIPARIGRREQPAPVRS